MRPATAAGMAAATTLLPPAAPSSSSRFLPPRPRMLVVGVASLLRRSPPAPGGGCCCSCRNGEAGEAPASSRLEMGSGTRRRMLGLGLGLLALPLTTSDAGATRVQYYATVGERLCDLNFVKSGLGYCDVAVGTGVEPPPGQLINIHYTARFEDGTVFDSSYKRGRPLTLRIGLGKVIPGLDQGILGGGGVPPMLVGGKRKLLIPPELAYGPEAAGCFSDMVRGSRSGGRQSSGRGSTGRPPAQLGASSSAGRGSSIPTAGRGSSIPTAGRPFRAPLPHDMIQSVLPPPGPHAPTPRAPPPPPVSAPLPPPPVSAPLPPPPDLAAVGQTAYTPSPPLSAGGLDDQASQHEGEGSTDVHTGRTVWINAGGKIEPSTASNYITRMIKTHFPGPVHQFSNFPLGAQDLLFEDFMRQFTFIYPSQQAKAKEAWRTTAAANFKQLLYKMRKKAEEASGGDMAQWKAHRPDWMQQVHWDGLCDIWADDRWTEKSAKMKANRAAQPEKNLHTGGSVSFATHKTRLETQFKRPAHFQEVFDVTHKKKGTDDYISARARETVESYGTRMEEKYGDKDQQPELDPEIWVEASGAPKKGHVYGFGHSLGSSRVLSSCASAASHATSPFATPPAAGAGSSPAPSMTEEQIMSAVERAVAQAMSQGVERAVAQAMSRGFSQMMSQGFSPRRAETPRHPHGAAPSQQHQDGPSAGRGADDQDDDAA